MESRNLSIRPKQKVNEQNRLQKMYILNEPAFQKVKREIDNEEYLSSMDKELKKILYNKKIPSYKKWLQYKEILTQYFNFKNFVKESKTNEDKASTDQLLTLENRIRELEKFIKTKTQSPVKSLTNAINSPIAELVEGNKSGDLEGNITPTEKIDLNETNPLAKGTNKGNKRKSTTPNLISQTNNLSRRQLDFGQGSNQQLNESFVPLENTVYTAPAGEEKYYSLFDNEAVGTTDVEPMDYSLAESEIQKELDDSNELHRIFDNEMIGKNTLRRRLDALPAAVRRKLLVNDVYPQPLFNIVYFDNDEEEQITVNALDVTVVKEDALKYYTHNNVVNIYNVRADSMYKIRLYLIDFHSKIDREFENYQKQEGNLIGTKPYSIRDKDQYSKIVRYKGDGIATVPNELLEDVIELIKSGDITQQQFKSEIKKMKKTFESNLNRTMSKPQGISNLKQTKTSIGRDTSTPSAASKRKLLNLSYGEDTMRKISKTFKEPQNKKYATSPNNQEGKGFKTKFGWKTI